MTEVIIIGSHCECEATKNKNVPWSRLNVKVLFSICLPLKYRDSLKSLPNKIKINILACCVYIIFMIDQVISNFKNCFSLEMSRESEKSLTSSQISR